MTPNYNRAAAKAYQTLLALRISALPIDPLMILHQCKNTAVHTYEEVMPRFGVRDPQYFKSMVMERKDALTVRRDQGGRIVYEMFYDARANPRRMRYTIAHELGHILLNHRMEEPWEEREADYFASQLLAPRPVFNVLAAYGYDSGNPEVIAAAFQLSKAAAEIAARAPCHQPETGIYRAVYDQFEEYVKSISKVLKAM